MSGYDDAYFALSEMLGHPLGNPRGEEKPQGTTVRIPIKNQERLPVAPQRAARSEAPVPPLPERRPGTGGASPGLNGASRTLPGLPTRRPEGPDDAGYALENGAQIAAARAYAPFGADKDDADLEAGYRRSAAARGLNAAAAKWRN